MNTRYEFNMDVPPREAIRLLYVSKSRFGGDWNSVPHTHSCTEVFYCVDGRGQFNVEGKMLDVAPDDMVIVNPRTLHTELSYQANPLEYIVLGIEGIEILFDQKDHGYTMLKCGPQREELLSLMQLLLREIDAREDGCEMVCQDLTEVLLVRIVRMASVSLRLTAPPAESKECATAKRYIDENYSESITLDKLAQGIGMGQSTGTVSFMTPSYEITQSGEKLTIDGVELEFQLTPGTEAPSEMNTWLPQYKALWMAENCTGTLHNLYTLRGAEVRDGAAWASYITEAISLYGKEAEVTFQSHNWPHWGNDVVNDYMVNTAAVYKYINDQTLTYINQGYTSDEISNMIELPEALNKIWYTRQYYGTVAHNAKAVYQKFMGWYDSNPVNLNPLMPSDSAKKWVEYLGDVDKVLQMAKADFDKGEYQWVAEVTNTIVFADPTNTDARLLCADALEQLGYQAESGPWRNEYLTAAQELRHGNANFTASTKSTGDMVKALSAPMLFDYMAIVMDKQALADCDFTMNVILPDVGEQHMLRVKNGVLLVYADTLSDDADVSITCPKNALFAILTNNQETVAKAVKVEGSAELLTLMMENMNQLPITGTNPFNIIEP